MHRVILQKIVHTRKLMTRDHALQKYVMPGIVYANHTQNRIFIVHVAFTLIYSWIAWKPSVSMVEEEGNTFLKGPIYFIKIGVCQPPHYWRHGVSSRGVRVYWTRLHSVPGY